MAYRITWLFLCGVLGVIGCVVALTWTLTTVVMMLLLAALVGGVVAMIALDPEGTSRLPRDKRRIVATSSSLAGAGAVAFVGLGTLLGAPMALLLVAMTVGGSPYAMRYYVGWLRQHGHLPSSPSQNADLEAGERSLTFEPAPAPRPALDQAGEHQAPASSLSDDALCLAWRASFSALQRADSPAQRLHIVEQRLAYLDELERRNARGLTAWLASGARAAGDPSRFVLGDSTAGDSAIDWDRLIHGTDK